MPRNTPNDSSLESSSTFIEFQRVSSGSNSSDSFTDVVQPHPVSPAFFSTSLNPSPLTSAYFSSSQDYSQLLSNCFSSTLEYSPLPFKLDSSLSEHSLDSTQSAAITANCPPIGQNAYLTMPNTRPPLAKTSPSSLTMHKSLALVERPVSDNSFLASRAIEEKRLRQEAAKQFPLFLTAGFFHGRRVGTYEKLIQNGLKKFDLEYENKLAQEVEKPSSFQLS